MTVTDDDLQPTEYDPLAALTAEELSAGSRQLKASIIKAITEGTQDYERALAVVLWLHHRRHEPGVGLTRFLSLPFSELSDQLGALAPEQPDPTTPGSSPS